MWCNGLEWIICPNAPAVPLIAPHPMSGAPLRPHAAGSAATHKRGGFEAKSSTLPDKYPLYEKFRPAAWSYANTVAYTK